MRAMRSRPVALFLLLIASAGAGFAAGALWGHQEAEGRYRASQADLVRCQTDREVEAIRQRAGLRP
jgi:type II secretory pathway component PulL